MTGKRKQAIATGLAQTGIGVASGIIGTLTLAIIGTVAALTRRRTLRNRN